jgi:hypothetical protein
MFSDTFSVEMLDDTLLCSSEISQGTESLPHDIINSVSDLFPRRLWGRPEEDLPHKPKYLLTLTVGAAQKQGVNDAISKFSKEWQILLFHYDGKMDEWDEFEWSRNAIHIGTRKQAKWYVFSATVWQLFVKSLRLYLSVL